MATPRRADVRPRRRLALRILAGLAVIIGAASAYLFLYEPAYGAALVTPPSRPLVFAHRGFGDLAPDNSIFAVERALDARMDGVDVDGQLTRDGVLVIFHDLSVDRLTSGTGRVREIGRASCRERVFTAV